MIVAVATLFPARLRGQEVLPPCPWPGPVQYLMDRPSPPDSVMIDIAGGSLKVCYSRPSARSRTVFGELVPFGRLWRTGANEPTLMHLNVAAEIAGVRVQPGTYLLLTVPGRDVWTVVLGTSDAPTPAQMFGDMVEVGRGQVPVERLGGHVETFTMRGGGNGAAELVLEWEAMQVRIPIRKP